LPLVLADACAAAVFPPAPRPVVLAEASAAAVFTRASLPLMSAQGQGLPGSRRMGWREGRLAFVPRAILAPISFVASLRTITVAPGPVDYFTSCLQQWPPGNPLLNMLHFVDLFCCSSFRSLMSTHHYETQKRFVFRNCSQQKRVYP
jgi:hypothetical protein